MDAVERPLPYYSACKARQEVQALILPILMTAAGSIKNVAHIALAASLCVASSPHLVTI